MKTFSKLFTAIDHTTSTNEKIDALVHYFETAAINDATWTVALLSGKRPKRTVKTGELWSWCAELLNMPTWLFAESYHVVGDLAETLTLLLPASSEPHDYVLSDVIRSLVALGSKNEAQRRDYITYMWRHLQGTELFIFNKLITGGFRMGVSDKIVIKALARHFNIDENIVAHRLTGNWNADDTSLHDLIITQNNNSDLSKPYPFYLAYPLEIAPEELGNIEAWQIERKYDGIRGQLILRDGQLFIWSRGEDLLTDKFVEFHSLKNVLPNGTVLDGEILPMQGDKILPFHVMQTRTGRKNVTKKALTEAPLLMICYDLPEHQGIDIRHLTLQERRAMLESLVINTNRSLPGSPLHLSPIVQASNWDDVKTEREKSRQLNCEGLMLKRKDSTYKTGRRKGDWWKWKIDPYSVDGVLIYAQRGHGRRANLYTDFTFAVWDGDELVPFTKAYSGLTDKELVEIDTWIKKNTTDKFGPVRSVIPHHVFEIGFEGINPSPRHKSGIALRFPRILRWRKDKTAEQADTKATLLELLKAQL